MRLSDYWYRDAVSEFHLLISKTYVFHVFVAIIAPKYYFCGQSFDRVKSDSFAATNDIDKQVDDTADVAWSVVFVTNRVCKFYRLYAGP